MPAACSHSNPNPGHAIRSSGEFEKKNSFSVFGCGAIPRPLLSEQALQYSNKDIIVKVRVKRGKKKQISIEEYQEFKTFGETNQYKSPLNSHCILSDSLGAVAM